MKFTQQELKIIYNAMSNYYENCYYSCLQEPEKVNKYQNEYNICKKIIEKIQKDIDK